MLRRMETMEGYTVAATDGVIGQVNEFYFDDAAWVVRYLVVETGDWLAHRKVLISPISAVEPDWTAKVFPISIGRAQVRNSPNIDTDAPVSRQQEEGFLRYLDYPYYWGGASLWGGGLYPRLLAFDSPDHGAAAGATTRASQYRNTAGGAQCSHGEPHLRSGSAVMRCRVYAEDGIIGHVRALLIDDATCAIRYLLVSTGDWWAGHDVLIAPEWIDDINWSEGRLVVDLTRRAVAEAPAYDSMQPVTGDLEADTFKHYGREEYTPPGTTHAHSRPLA